MIPRSIGPKLKSLLEKFPVVSLTGARQSGKTTLLKELFSDMDYVSLENPDDRQLALEDPRGFLSNYPSGGIFDEVQRAPQLFSYLQGVVDADKSKKFVLSGSQNFLLMESISQSLAGRTAVLKLCPLSLGELDRAGLLDAGFEEVAFKGFYPRIFDQQIAPRDFYPNYVQTYIERDVRQLKQVGDLETFTVFLKMCAGRAGQLLNLSEMANDTGISVNTVKSWINILETSFILFRLYPHHKNYTKRLIKMPKLYFYDTGLLCFLLGIREAAQVKSHYAKGAIFENLVIADILKQYHHKGEIPNLYFWRDHAGKEVDLIIEDGIDLTPVEIKSAATLSMRFFEGLNYWCKLSGNSNEKSVVVYGGDRDYKSSNGSMIGWRSIADWGG